MKNIISLYHDLIEKYSRFCAILYDNNLTRDKKIIMIRDIVSKILETIKEMKLALSEYLEHLDTIVKRQNEKQIDELPN